MQETVFRSEDLPVTDRFTRWRDMACQAHVPTMVRSEHERDFRATLRVLQLGAIQISSLTHPSLRVERTRKGIRQSDPGTYCLALPLRGTVRFAQSGREAECGPQDLMFYETSRPFHGWIAPHDDGDVSHMVIQIPRDALPQSSAELGRLTAVRLPAREGIGALLSNHLRETARQAGTLTPADTARLSSVTLDLLGALCAHHLHAEPGAGVEPETRRQVLRAQIHDFIQRRLGDSSLTADVIASAHHISTRYLYTLFDDQDLGVAGWVRRQRLERCRRDLGDPHLRSRPIHSIAARWGFPDRAHFSRTFRAAYGKSPRDYRNSVQYDDGCA
ncbi:helix-turn-helix domain-containing protein [Microbispora triticiradicis]|uniref:Helix-turn-helix domain-containing protein n=1 Tax=Microbispora triticiradicis TaxID=2200763 RepID=A0ABX9LCG8_9ACTN|nr:helix-turn-helix domain-containing protein [Microbispora triticiradicis]GLW20225.1 AraC family transcriptional regulator [Microbispora amethystogenes]